MVARRAVPLVAAVLTFLAAGTGARLVAQDTGWVIDRYHSDISVQPDGSLEVVETIDVDFQNLERHGIYREIPVVYGYDEEQNRVLRIDLDSVTDDRGNRVQTDTEREGANLRIRIGDPDRTVSGKQTYRIAYRVDGALNAFDEHDELYWNVNGFDWPVPIRSSSATVSTPGGAVTDVTCFQGPSGSRQACASSFDSGAAAFQTTRQLGPGEQLTVVVGMPKGVVAEPAPILVSRPRTPDQFFQLGRGSLLATMLALVGGIALVARTWWRVGRDRSFTSLYYLTEDPDERTRPLLHKEQVVVEFQPPERLRPAEIGLLLDERADPKDVTATIIDLAVRGYLTITEVEPDGLLGGRFGRKDWLLERQKDDTSDLHEYERLAFEGLFAEGDQVRLSDLKEEYFATLETVQDELYASAAEKGWFPENPETTRNKWLALGFVVAGLGVLLAIALGYTLGFGLAGVPVFIVGLVLIPLSRAMARRSALGSELLRRVLGFREYMVTAETDRQQFFEKAHIFSEYLPYAIVFGCVDRWAKAFEGIEGAAESTASWYRGGMYTNPLMFSHALQGLNSTVSDAIASTPASSGSSGFSGGFSGGGMGGGGGGSW